MEPLFNAELASRKGEQARVGTQTKGMRQMDTQICVSDITLIRVSLSPSALTRAFQVACTIAAPSTIKTI